ncbi:hypothetical protein ACOKFD_11695 [Flagellimonas sp. S174]
MKIQAHSSSQLGFEYNGHKPPNNVHQTSDLRKERIEKEMSLRA